jgi:hypothetical protein
VKLPGGRSATFPVYAKDEYQSCPIDVNASVGSQVNRDIAAF